MRLAFLSFPLLAISACGGEGEKAKADVIALPSAFAGTWSDGRFGCGLTDTYTKTGSLVVSAHAVAVDGVERSVLGFLQGDADNEGVARVTCANDGQGTCDLGLRRRGDILMVAFEDEVTAFTRCTDQSATTEKGN